MKLNKKAIMGHLLVIAVILGFSVFLFYTVKYQDEKGGLKAEQRVIGELQTKLLEQMMRAEKAMLYIEESAKLSAADAKAELAENGGYFEPQETYLGYAVWNFDEQKLPDSREGLSKYLTEYLDTFMMLYEEIYLPADNYDYYFGDGYIMGFASSNLLPVPYTRSIGNPLDADNQVVACRDSGCLSDVAESYSRLYSGLPYVWGGESPYTYTESLKDQQENPNSIFKGVSLTRQQPAGNKRSGQPTVPGFDCSGFFWWVYQHAGIVQARLSANGYYTVAKQEWEEVCDGDCNKKTILADAHEGDAMFIAPCTSGVCHIGIYMGDGTILESSGDAGVVERPIPARYYNGMIVAVYSPEFNSNVQQTNEEPADFQEVFDPPVSASDPIYSVKPNFKIASSHDVQFYDSLRSQAFDVSRKLQACANIACVVNSLPEGWELACGADSAFFSVVQQIEDCAESINDNCICDIAFGKGMEIDANTEHANLEYSGYAFNISKTLALKGSPMAPTAEIEGNKLIIEDGEASLDIIDYLTTESPAQEDYTLAPKLYKHGDTVYFLADAAEMPACQMPKKTYPICIEKDVTYRLALR